VSTTWAALEARIERLEQEVESLRAENQVRVEHAVESGLAALGFGINAGLASLREEVVARFDRAEGRFDRIDAQLRRMEDWQSVTSQALDQALAEILRRLPPGTGV